MAELCRQLPLWDAAVTISACMGCSSRPQTGLGIAPDPTAWRGKVFGGSVPSSDTRCKTVLWGGRGWYPIGSKVTQRAHTRLC